MDNNYTKFFSSIKHNKRHFYVKQVGLIAASPNSSIITINKAEPYSLIDVFVFNIKGILILSHHFKDTSVSDILLSIIQSSIKRLNHIHSSKQLKNFSFYQIETTNLQLFFLYKSNLIVVGVFRNGMNKYYCKLVLIHLFIALTNFKLNICDKIALLNDTQQGLNITNIIKQKQPSSVMSNEFNFYDYIELKIFEKYLMKYIITHFSIVFQSITQKSELFLTVIKLKNVLFIDIANEKILFDYAEINKSKKKINFKKNELIWKQLIHFSNVLFDNYNKHNGKNYSFNENESKFIKFECTSTYPRYSFFVKFFPILKGVSIVHVYSQNKLSRQSDDVEKKKNYSEFDIIYSFDINKVSMSYEFKYAQPPQLSNIQHFIGEFLLSINKQTDLYCDQSHSKQLLYFNMDIINEINSISFDNISNKTIEEIFSMLNKKLNILFQKEFNGITLSCGSSLKKRVTPTTKLLQKVTNVNDLNKLITIDKNVILCDLFEKQNGILFERQSIVSNDIKSLSPMITNRFFRNTNTNENSNPYGFYSKNFNPEEIQIQRESTGKNNRNTITINNNKLVIPVNEINNSTMLSISKLDEIPKEEVSINLSRKISDINGNNILGENNQNARKRSFFDERIVPFNEEYFNNDNKIDSPYVGKIKEKKIHLINGQSFDSHNQTKNKSQNQTQSNICLHKLSIMPERNTKLLRFFSLKLGKYYCKEIASKQLIMQENIGKVLTFQEQK